MDPVAHTLTGAALAAAGLRRVTPLATAALLIGANAADVDAVLMFAGDYLSVAHRRGWTHGVAALVVLPPLLAGMLLIWDRHARRRLRPDAPPARAGPLLAVCAVAVLSHPLLDWLNNYGMRWLMPFDGRWFYGDALFIIDPWVWLAFGGVAFLTWSRHPAALLAWIAFWLLTSWLVLTSPMVPDVARALWVAGVLALAGARWRLTGAFGASGRVARPAAVTVAAVAVYMGMNLAANLPARADVAAALTDAGHGPVLDVMVGPTPANPLTGQVVAATEDAYHLGDWHWLRSPRFRPDGRTVARPDPSDPVFQAAAGTPHARRFLTWARYPYVDVQNNGDAVLVRFGDARYTDRPGPGAGPVIRLDPQLRPDTPAPD